ncbi:MAG: ferritin-like domain-containing protein [candidate division Zixibacteria bacterium]|nr:ferritin-like domain-containing protein [candidate division Zixibacteria bacterium]
MEEDKTLASPAQNDNQALQFLAELSKPVVRRRFLTWSGITIAVAATAGCGGDDKGTDPPPQPTGDTGVLNFAYALEQLEAAYYTQVVSSFYAGATAQEMQVLTDLRDHEIIHRDFLKAALGDKAIGTLDVTFEDVNFASRTSVLETARTFEDLGVSAYNGSGDQITDPNNLLLAGKIVSVEARHASVIRDLLAPRTAAFAGDDVVNAGGLDVKREVAEVLPLVDPFVVTPLDGNIFR